MNDTVVNLSTFPLTSDQRSLLAKGLNFCPTPGNSNPGEQRTDLDNLHRRLRLKYHFSDEEDDVALSNTASNFECEEPFAHRKFRLKSRFNPTGPPALEAMIMSNEHAFNRRPCTPPPLTFNLTEGERKAIFELKNSHQIVIKKADKGSCTVVQDRTAYIAEGMRQLSDENFYRQVPNDLTEKHRAEVQSVIDQMYEDDELDISVVNYLAEKDCRTPQMYFLPKIHKGVTPPPGRPICSGNGSPTEKISQLVDHFLNPIAQKVPSYVKDTTHFLQILNSLGTLPPNCILATLDVTSLYTNIPNEFGKQACKEGFDEFRPNPRAKPSNISLLKLMDLILTKNNFDFNGQHYLQTGGTAMGTKMAPSYAIKALGKFEVMYVYTYHKQPIIWLRYIDDIFIIWPHGEDELHAFVEHLNNCEDTIKFTLEFSTQSINFLDTTVTLNNGQLETDLYCKPTDTHDYLMYSSSHPLACKNSIPYSQFLRIRRICSTLANFDKNAKMIGCHFLRRGYPCPLIEEAAIKARRLDRNELLSPPTPTISNDEDPMVLITTYHPRDETVKSIVTENWDIMGKSTLTSFLRNKKCLTGYRRPKNLRDLLVRSKLPTLTNNSQPGPTNTLLLTSETPNPGITSSSSTGDLRQAKRKPTNSPSLVNIIPSGNRNVCKNKKCRYCPVIDTSGVAKCTATGKMHECKRNISCRSSNLVYLVTCKTCGLQYVGQTKRRINQRFQGHYYKINSNRATDGVGSHFALPNHNGTKDLKIQVLEFIRLPPDSARARILRLQLEKNWIHKLRCPAPYGLNIMD